MSSDIAIKVECLSKRYHIYDKPSDRLLQMFAGSRRKYYREFWAVRDVSFDVKVGETVGILGFNGAGKSTLLQMICGTLNPSSGHVHRNGNIAALLELGAGFNPEFTGRENVFMSCALHGMSKREIENKFFEIEEFAGIGEFIDRPVKTYSSGMFARLAFSAAVHVNPRVLIIDEALSVGDMAFQEKSISRMKEIKRSGTSILFVTHSISAVRNFCDRAIWMDRGCVKAIGERLAICDAYQNEVENEIRGRATTPPAVMNAGTGRVECNDEKTISIISVNSDKKIYSMGDDIFLNIFLGFNKESVRFGIGLIFYDSKGNIATIINTLRDDIVISENKPEWRLRIRDNHLAPGEYTATLSVSDEQAMFSYDKLEHCVRFSIAMERNAAGLARVEGIVRCEHEWI